MSDGGEYVDITQGISLGCPLSPLMGALYLKPLDDRMAELGCFYVRFMDDWVVLAPTRWRLRKAIKVVNEVIADLRVEQHPNKTRTYALTNQPKYESSAKITGFLCQIKFPPSQTIAKSP